MICKVFAASTQPTPMPDNPIASRISRSASRAIRNTPIAPSSTTQLSATTSSEDVRGGNGYRHPTGEEAGEREGDERQAGDYARGTKAIARARWRLNKANDEGEQRVDPAADEQHRRVGGKYRVVAKLPQIQERIRRVQLARGPSSQEPSQILRGRFVFARTFVLLSANWWRDPAVRRHGIAGS